MGGTESGAPPPEWIMDRADVLSALRTEPRSRRELVDQLGVSRTTAYRVTTGLADEGLIERDGRDYRTTAIGVAMADAADRFQDKVETVTRLQPLLDAIDSAELAANAYRFVDAHVTVADETDPYAPTDRLLELYAVTTHIRGGRVAARPREAIIRATAALHDGMTVEVCYLPSTLETTLQYMTEAQGYPLVPDEVSLFVAESIPFTFGLYDDIATVTGHDETTGLPTVFVESTAPAARDWLEGLYERCLESASPVDPETGTVQDST